MHSPTMHRFILSTLVALATLSAAAQDTRRMAQAAESHAADHKFMGAVLVAKAGQPLFAQTYGFANLEWQTAFTPDTKFRLGSLTKQFTAAAILLLEERGKLVLDDLVSQHLPDTPPAWQIITIRHLLTHTSGIPNVTSQPGYATWKLRPSPPEQTLAHVRDLPLEFTPGEKFAYSNSGYILLGQLIEHLSGRSYAAFVTDEIFQPLGMTNSGYDSNRALIPHRASGYVPGPDGPTNAPYVDLQFPHAAGGLYSTTHDLVRWTEGVFGGTFLSPASRDKMIAPFKNDYALGVAVKTIDGLKSIEHGGGIEGFNTYLAYHPETRLTVVVLANINGPAAAELAGQLAAIASDQPVTLPSERATVTVSDEILQSYVGIYQLTPQLTITMRFTKGRLTTQLSGQPAFPVFAESETKFFLKVVNAQLEFIKNASGRVTDVVLHQNGRSQKAPRISDTVTEPTAIELPRAVKASYVGTYELSPDFILTITLNGDQLMSQATGQANFPLFPESETKFFFKVVDAQIEFFKNPDGTVPHLILHQAGREMKALRK